MLIEKTQNINQMGGRRARLRSLFSPMEGLGHQNKMEMDFLKGQSVFSPKNDESKMKLSKLFRRRSTEDSQDSFLNKQMPDGLSAEEKRKIKLRYKDTAKYVIWPACRLPETPVKNPRGPAPLSPTEFGRSNVKADLEDPRTPFPKPAINAVLRSDSEGSSEDEDVVFMTRL